MQQTAPVRNWDVSSNLACVSKVQTTNLPRKRYVLFIFFFHSVVNFPSLYPVLETLQGNRDSSGLVLGVIPKLSLFTSFSRVLPTSSVISRCKNPEKHYLLLNKMFNSLLVFNFHSLPSPPLISFQLFQRPLLGSLNFQDPLIFIPSGQTTPSPLQTQR